MSTFLQDFRYAFRTLSRNRAFAVVSILTVALGIGANTAMFTLINAVLVKSLPVLAPDLLVVLSKFDADNESDTSFSYPMYRDLRDRNTVLSGLLARGGQSFNLTDNASNERVEGELVSGNYFDVLGIAPAAGRFFESEDDKAGSPAVAVISWPYWQSHFGGERSALGREISLNGYKATIVGVTPRDFFGTRVGSDVDVRVPMASAPQMRVGTNLESRKHQWMTLLGRRKPEVSSLQAQAEIDTLFHQIVESEAQALPSSTPQIRRNRFLNQKLALQSGRQGFAGTRRTMEKPLLLLLATTGLVLLIACANLAGLLLVRGAFRQKELAMRATLGAGRGRLIRQLLTESLLLSTLGGLAGFLASHWLSVGLVRILPVRNLRLDVSPDWTVFAYSMAAALVTGFLFGLLPAISATRGAGKASVLKSEAGTIARGERTFSVRGAMLAAQVALSVVMLYGAGLFLRTLFNLETLDAGFTKQNILVASIAPYLNGYKPAAARDVADLILDRVRTLPGVRFAGWSNESLIAGGWDQNGIVVEGFQPKNGDVESAHFDQVSPDYFSVVQIPLVAGRGFNDRDTVAAPKVAMVNEAFVRHFFGGRNAVGKHFRFDGEPADKEIQIVGVVRDARYVNLREKKALWFAYLPIAQTDVYSLVLHVRAAGNPEKLVPQLREQVRQVDPRLPLHGIRTLAAQIDESLMQERLMAILVSTFGAIATFLAALGLYGVLTFSVTRRSREIGVRMALGAQASQVAGLILRQTALLIGVGLAAGIAGCFAVAGVVRSLLFDVAAADAPTLAAAMISLVLVSATAAYLPARRAARIDPIEALRQE